MKKSLVLRNIKGFSLIEVLVFTAILGLFFVAAISVATFNLRNMKIQEHKIIATRYAEEGVEWLKQEKEDDWSTFIDHAAGNYCLNILGWTPTPNPCGEHYDLGAPALFKRELTIVKSGSPTDQVEGTITVSWKDMGTDLSVKIPTVFKLLE